MACLFTPTLNTLRPHLLSKTDAVLFDKPKKRLPEKIFSAAWQSGKQTL
jgi:hypothetical protein